MKKALTIWILAVAACSHGATQTPANPTLEPFFDENARKLAAQSTPDEPKFDGALPTYVDFALRNHPELHANYQQWRAATYRPDAAWDWPNPRLTYGFFIQSVETRVGPQRHRFGLMQPIPWPTKPGAMQDAAEADARIEESRYSSTMLEVRRRVAEKYWAIWAVDQKLAIQDEQIQIAETLALSARARVETGRASLADLNQIELTISRMHDMKARLQQKKKALEASLVAAVGLASYDGALPVRSDRPQTEGVDQARLETWTSRIENHPSLETMGAMSEKKRLMARSSTAQKYPDFALGIDYIETGEAMNPALEDSGKDPIIAMVTVELPIFSSSESAEVDAYEAEARSIESQREAMRHEMLAKVRSLASVLEETHRRVELYTDTLVPQAEASYTSVQSAYEVGQNQIAAVLLAQRDLVELQRALVDARAAHARAQVDIEALTASPLEVK